MSTNIYNRNSKGIHYSDGSNFYSSTANNVNQILDDLGPVYQNIGPGTPSFTSLNVSGTVGIGTLNPSQTLDVSGNGAISGGLNVGFSGTPTADRIAIGDANFYVDLNAGTPILTFDTGDTISYSRSSNFYNFIAGGTSNLQITGAGLIVGAPTGNNKGLGSINLDDVLYKDGVQVVSDRITGWVAATGTATRTTFVTSAVTTEQLAERVKALIDDLISHGLIGT